MLSIITTIVAVLGLAGSVVSLFFSKRALQKADHAIGIEKASHALLVLKGILDELDQWLIEYEQLQQEIFGKGYEQGNLEFPENFGERWPDIYGKFSDLYNRMEHTYPLIAKKSLEGRGSKLWNNLLNLQINKFPNYESAKYDKGKGLPSNYWDDADILFIEEWGFINLSFRKMIVNLITQKVAKLM